MGPAVLYSRPDPLNEVGIIESHWITIYYKNLKPKNYHNEMVMVDGGDDVDKDDGGDDDGGGGDDDGGEVKWSEQSPDNVWEEKELAR